MHNFDTMYLKHIFFVFFPMVIGSSNAWAALPLPMTKSGNSLLAELQEILLTGDSILLIGFLLWVAYIVFCMPKNTFKKL